MYPSANSCTIGDANNPYLCMYMTTTNAYSDYAVVNKAYLKNNNYQKITEYSASLAFTNGSCTLNLSTASGKSTITGVICTRGYATYDIISFSITNGGASAYSIALKNLSTSATKNITVGIIFTYS